MDRKQKGFSLIELLIVVAIILIIAAIAIPNLLRSKMAANEASSVSTLRTMTTAQITYSSTWGDGFSPDLRALGPTAAGVAATCDIAGLVDAVLSGNSTGGTATTFIKSGYTFTYGNAGSTAFSPPGPGCAKGGFPQFTMLADPQSLNGTGSRSFFVDETGTVHQKSGALGATAADPPVQ